MQDRSNLCNQRLTWLCALFEPNIDQQNNISPLVATVKLELELELELDHLVVGLCRR